MSIPEWTKRVWLQEFRDLLTRLNNLADELDEMIDAVPDPMKHGLYPRAWVTDARYLTNRVRTLLDEMTLVLKKHDDDDSG